jgi:predicted butyrate kinase (DUF1464 family)
MEDFEFLTAAFKNFIGMKSLASSIAYVLEKLNIETDKKKGLFNSNFYI